MGWILNGLTLRLSIARGLLYLFTVGWLFWPAEGVGVAICTLVSALLLGWMAWIVVTYRSTLSETMPDALEGTVYAYSWPRRLG